MRQVAVSQDGAAGVGTFPQLSAGSKRVLAGLHFHGIEPGSSTTTNTKTPTQTSWGFFLGDRAYCPERH